jgi:hypothetical protein
MIIGAAAATINAAASIADFDFPHICASIALVGVPCLEAIAAPIYYATPPPSQ